MISAQPRVESLTKEDEGKPNGDLPSRASTFPDIALACTNDVVTRRPYCGRAAPTTKPSWTE